MSLTFSRIWRKVISLFSGLGNDETLGKLGDFTVTPRVIVLSLFAIVIGVIGAFVALVLLRLIGLITNLSFYGRWDTSLVSPGDNHLGIFVIFVPIIGSLLVGLIARYGSERIRGHGIPEALEAILMNGSRVEPKVAVLKPIASAIAIGTGGPFGAEGPIIMTAGAFGSMIAQYFHLTNAERKTLLVAGAAAGMAAIFNTPIAAVLLAVELMLFEWKPRSLIPVALACVAATLVRSYLPGLGPGALFATPLQEPVWGFVPLAACIFAGVLAGVLAILLTISIYASEDIFHKLPIHWMWWPLIGGVVIGIGGIIYPPALGVGYDLIHQLVLGHFTMQMILGLLIVKSLIWSISLSSGTSGGVLAPIMLVGGALGALESLFLPHVFPGFWPLMSMTATLGAVIGCPLTIIVFAIELTRDVTMFLPLLITTIVAYGVIVLVLRRSILTEKISRRGYHLSREYATDPLEIIFVREVMRTNIVALSDSLTPQDLATILLKDGSQTSKLQRLYPVLSTEGRLQGVMTRNDLQHFQDTPIILPDGSQQTWKTMLATAAIEYATANGHGHHSDVLLDGQIASPHMLYPDPMVAYPDEPLRAVVYRMAETGYTRFPVVERDDPGKLVGMISLTDLLKARSRNLEEERHRERVLRLRLLTPQRNREKVNKV
ncbi:MAG: chloride channel protein [Ktedonobacteraceae bacterium]